VKYELMQERSGHERPASVPSTFCFEFFLKFKSTTNMAAVGMMDPAYFVGKVELLTWLNDLLKINYSKVEQVRQLLSNGLNGFPS
jgi:hypothetical protein